MLSAVIYVTKTWAETKIQRQNEMDSPNIKDFQAQLDCKLTYGTKNQTQLTLVQHIYSFMFKKKIQNQTRWWEKYSQTGITIKMHTNHDGVEAIMLRSIAASSSSRSPFIALKKASEITTTVLRVNKELALISFPMLWVEGHISHSRLVLRRCHPQQPSCSRKFGCRSFIKRLEQFVFVTWKPLLVYMNHNSTGFHWTFQFQILY